MNERLDPAAWLRLRETVAGFVATAPAQGSEVAELAAQLAAQGWQPRDVCLRLQRMVHRLAGSAGSLGYADLSLAAVALERLIRALDEEGGGLPSGVVLEQVALLAGVVAETASALAVNDSALCPGRPRLACVGIDLGAPVVLTVGVDPDIERALRDVGLLALDGGEMALEDGAADPLPPLAGVIVSLEAAGDPDARAWLKGVGQAGIPLLVVGGADTFLGRVRAHRLGADVYLPQASAEEAVDRLVQIIGEGGQEPLRVLMIEDDPLMGGLVSGVLVDAGLETELLVQPEAVLDRLEAFEPDVLLVNLGLRPYDGAEVTAVVRGAPAWGGVPIVALAEPRQTAVKRAALIAGVDLVLSRPVRPDVLVTALREQGRRGRRAREAHRHETETGLLTAEAMHEQLHREVARAQRSGVPLAVVLLDIDRLRALLLTHGPRAGGVVMRLVALSVRRRLRGTDVAGRCCGSAVAMILPGATVTQAMKVVDTILAEIHASRVMMLEGALTFTVSAGVAGLEGQGVSLLDAMAATRDLMTRAEEALSEARRRGGACVVQGSLPP
ncbi:diguanylate cyclase [Pararhodospirillum oryzae]|uniref:diguanylate cyclase n=1 Tax=Pararhodospirillum oryzae TaxID=478448 RepID=A0A512H4A8_9PROT|nr:diguanylate cyclase [Pararhodospirillum oryzae]GEO80277.1 diguanylate cyclase [Pararhodospirillum oryzae]